MPFILAHQTMRHAPPATSHASRQCRRGLDVIYTRSPRFLPYLNTNTNKTVSSSPIFHLKQLLNLYLPSYKCITKNSLEARFRPIYCHLLHFTVNPITSHMSSISYPVKPQFLLIHTASNPCICDQSAPRNHLPNHCLPPASPTTLSSSFFAVTTNSICPQTFHTMLSFIPNRCNHHLTVLTKTSTPDPRLFSQLPQF